jgi:hypothetical protein
MATDIPAAQPRDTQQIPTTMINSMQRQRHELRIGAQIRVMRGRPGSKMTFRGWLPLLGFIAMIVLVTWLTYPWQKQSWLSQFPTAGP